MSERAQLNAFVDGELPAAQAAALSERLSHDPALAAQVDALRAVKAGVAGLAEEPPAFTFPRATPAPVTPWRRSVWRLMPVAATVCLALGLAWTQRHSLAPDTAPDLAANLAANLALDTAANIAPHAAPDMAANMAPDTARAPIAMPAAYAAERRVLARFDFLPAPVSADGAQERVYYGARGCVLTIIDGPREVLARRHGEGGAGQSHLWTQGGRAQLILARNMDPARFAFFTTLLSDLWQEAGQNEARALLAQAPNAAPCIG